MAGFAFKPPVHSFLPAGAPEKINEFTQPVAVRGNVACQPAPAGIKELWQLMIFSHVKKDSTSFRIIQRFWRFVPFFDNVPNFVMERVV